MLLHWNRPWSEIVEHSVCGPLPGHELDGRPVAPIEMYQSVFRRWGIDPGPKGDHLQSLIWAARREILERIDGFPIGVTYGEAIAAEIAVSKKVQALGLRTVQVAWRPFTYIQHREWTHTQKLSYLLRWRARNSAQTLLSPRLFNRIRASPAIVQNQRPLPGEPPQGRPRLAAPEALRLLKVSRSPMARGSRLGRAGGLEWGDDVEAGWC